MDPSILAAYDRPVPRYTSYPSAAHFTGDIGPSQHRDALAALGRATVGLYLHVPFCRELCWYCACHTMAMRREGTLDAYAEALARELLLLEQTAPDIIVGSVQWGGGTPTHLGAQRLRGVARRIATLFDRGADAEISMEVDPRHCDAAMAQAMARLGVTRVSLGVQDFDPGVQDAINRQQSFEATATTLDALRDAGIHRFNVDLVYGLPRQTLETLGSTLDQALRLAPNRFAVFGYAHVPWMKPHQKLIDAATLPDASDRAEMASLVASRLSGAGYIAVGLDHYARPDDSLAKAAASGTLKRNFQGYVADLSPWVVGLGASAISCLPQGYSQNTADAADYMDRIGKGGFATARGIVVGAADRLRAEIIGELMCRYGADLEAACGRHHVDTDLFLASIDGLDRLLADGIVALEGYRLRVTPAGRPLVRFVCAAFDRHYRADEGRHARGI